MSRKRASKQGKKDPWEAFIFTLLFGLLILIAGGLNIYTIVIGSGITFLAFVELPSFRLYFELKVNKLTGANVFQVSDSEVSDSTVIGNVKGPLIIQQPRTREKLVEPRWPIRSKFTLDSDEHNSVKVRMRKGQKLSGEVKSNGMMDVYVMSQSSLRTFEDGEEPNPYWSADGVTETTLDFESNADRDAFVVVSNEYGEENDDYVLQVEVMLRVE